MSCPFFPIEQVVIYVLPVGLPLVTRMLSWLFYAELFLQLDMVWLNVEVRLSKRLPRLLNL